MSLETKIEALTAAVIALTERITERMLRRKQVARSKQQVLRLRKRLLRHSDIRRVGSGVSKQCVVSRLRLVAGKFRVVHLHLRVEQRIGARKNGVGVGQRIFRILQTRLLRVRIAGKRVVDTIQLHLRVGDILLRPLPCGLRGLQRSVCRVICSLRLRGVDLRLCRVRIALQRA